MKTRLILTSLITTLIFTAILLLVAGRSNYFQAWLYLGTGIITSFMTYFSTRNNEELMKERSKVGEGSKGWDKLILGISTIIFFILLVVAGLDSGRYGWSPKMHLSVYAAGIALIIAGQTLFLKAKKENTFFSAVVRIQTDCGHTVCDTGVYKSVRHPGYPRNVDLKHGFTDDLRFALERYSCLSHHYIAFDKNLARRRNIKKRIERIS